MSRSLRAVLTAVLACGLAVGVATVVGSPQEGVAFAQAHDPADEHPPAHTEGAEAAGHEGAGHDSGAEHGHGGAPAIDTKKLALQLVNFAVLLFVLIKFGGGAINKALAARHNQLKADLAAAAELKAAAEAKLARQEARLASLEKEIAQMRQGLHAEAEAEKARLIAAAEERARRIKDETTFLMEQQTREAESRLRRESAEAALKTAEEILRRVVGPADRQRMLDTFVADVERGAPAPRTQGGV